MIEQDNLPRVDTSELLLALREKADRAKLVLRACCTRVRTCSVHSASRRGFTVAVKMARIHTAIIIIDAEVEISTSR